MTGLKGRDIDFDTESESLAFISEANKEVDNEATPALKHRLSKPNGRFAFSRPDFVTKKTSLTAAQQGTALHLAMQNLDFQMCGSETGVKDELRRLTEKGLLSEEQAAAVEAKKILRFFGSDLGNRVQNADKTWREFKFSLLYKAKQLYPEERFSRGGGDDEILLQGVVDCFFEENGELTVVDFKTDYVTPDILEEKAGSYAPQLEAYADALERITGKRVKEKIIYFFEMAQCYYYD